MKARIPCLLLVILAAFTAQADMIVYKTTQKTRYVGEGRDFKISSTGFLVLDASSLNGYTIATYNNRGDKIFTVLPFEEGLRFYAVTGAVGRTHTVWVGSAVTNKTSQFQDLTEFGIGTDAVLAITPTNSVRLPRVITGSFGGIAIPDSGPTLAANGTGVASYSQNETRLANSLGETPIEALARYRASLLNRGYREVTD